MRKTIARKHDYNGCNIKFRLNEFTPEKLPITIDLSKIYKIPMTFDKVIRKKENMFHFSRLSMKCI